MDPRKGYPQPYRVVGDLSEGERTKLVTGSFVDLQFHVFDAKSTAGSKTLGSLRILGEKFYQTVTKLNMGIHFDRSAKVPQQTDVLSPEFKLFTDLSTVINNFKALEKLSVVLVPLAKLQPGHVFYAIPFYDLKLTTWNFNSA